MKKETPYDGYDLIDAVHHHLSQKNYNHSVARREAKKEIRFYPSSVGQCMRKNVYQMLGYIGRPEDGNDLLVLENGTYYHDRMEHIFKDMGILISEELSLKDEDLAISGRSDAIIWDLDMKESEEEDDVIILHDPKGKEVYKGPRDLVKIIEFKSIKQERYNELKRTPKKHHIQQLQLYFYLTGIRKGAIYYENKNTQEQKMYDVAYDQTIVDQVLEEIRQTVDFAKRGELPERPYLPTDIPCRYCRFRDICHSNPNPFSYDELFGNIERPF